MASASPLPGRAASYLFFPIMSTVSNRIAGHTMDGFFQDSDSDSPAYCSEPDSLSGAEDVSSVDTTGTDCATSSDGQCDTSSENN